MILDYKSVKNKPKTLRAMTSLDRAEFEKLCSAFSEAWNEHTHQHEKDPTKGGRNPSLKTIQDRLFFILFYLKVYPVQEVLAHLFGMSQGQANFYIYELTQHSIAKNPEKNESSTDSNTGRDVSKTC
jgi:hypothetical protein